MEASWSQVLYWAKATSTPSATQSAFKPLHQPFPSQMFDGTNPYNNANYSQLVAEQPNRSNPSLDRVSSAMSASGRTGEHHTLPKQGTLFPNPIQLFAVAAAQFPSSAFWSTAPGATLHCSSNSPQPQETTQELSHLSLEPLVSIRNRPCWPQWAARFHAIILSPDQMLRTQRVLMQTFKSGYRQWKESGQHHSNTVHRQLIPKMSSAKSSTSQLESPTNLASTYLLTQYCSTGGAFSSTGPKHLKQGHKCEGCGKMFARSNYLICHLQTHTGEKPYNCKQCKRQFSFRSNLNLHIKRVHLNQNDFNCHLYDWFFFPNVDQDRGQKRHKTDGLTQSPTYTDDEKEDELVVQKKETHTKMK